YYAGDVTVVEGNSGPKSRSIAVPVTLSNPGTGTQLTIDYTIEGGTATNGTVAPADYTAKAAGQLKFKLGKNGQTFIKAQVVVKIIADTDDTEGDETFELRLSNPQGGGGGFTEGDGVGTVTIRDDDDEPAPGVVVSVGDASSTEGDASNYQRAMKLP